MLIIGHKEKVIRITSIILTLTLLIILISTSCNNEETSLLKNTPTPSQDGVGVNLPEKDLNKDQEKQINSSSSEQLDSSNFIRSSLQDGRYVNLNGEIICIGRVDGVFYDQVWDRKFKFLKSIKDAYQIDWSFSTNKVYTYNNKLVFLTDRSVDGSKSLPEILIVDTVSNEIKTIRLNAFGSRTYYILGNRIYFDEYGYLEDNIRKSLYTIKYVNLDTQEQKMVCSYNGEFDASMFVLREDGAVAYTIYQSDGMSQIFTFNNGLTESIITKKWCSLIDYDKKGLYFISPAKTEQELNNMKVSAYDDDMELIFKSGNTPQKVLFRGDAHGDFKIYDDFFIRIDLLRMDEIEKYNYEGKLIKRQKLKVWPSFGKRVITWSGVIPHQGDLLNVFYRGDRNELEVQEVNLD